MPVARRMVFDTNVYVAALREGLDAMRRIRRVVIELVERFERLGRVVVPTAGSWNDIGDLLAKIARREPPRLRAPSPARALRIGGGAGRSSLTPVSGAGTLDEPLWTLARRL